MMKMLNLKRNDSAIGLYFTLMNKKYKPINLTNSTIKFIMSNSENEILINRLATITDAINGKVSFYFQNDEIDVVGKMKLELEVVYPNGLLETFPNKGHIPLEIVDRLNGINSIIIDGGLFTEIIVDTIDSGNFLDNTSDFIDGGGFR